MSAIEALSPVDRRESERLSPTRGVRVTVGRGSGLLIDISCTGMRTRHCVSAIRGSCVRVTFEWERHRFDAIAEVLASRVASLGNSSGAATTFETRLRFTSMGQDSAALLDRVLAQIRCQELRRWVANLRGWTESPDANAGGDDDGAFIRCRFIGMRWRTTWTHDATQPDDGFAVPASIRPVELEKLCETYRNAGAEGRYLIRRMAEEAVREATVLGAGAAR